MNDSSTARKSRGALRGLLALPSAPQDKSCPEAKDLPRPWCCFFPQSRRVNWFARNLQSFFLESVGELQRYTSLPRPLAGFTSHSHPRWFRTFWYRLTIYKSLLIGVARILDWGAQTTIQIGEDHKIRSSQFDLGFLIGGGRILLETNLGLGAPKPQLRLHSRDQN